MSLTVGTGQLGFALGGTLAGFTYARYGYGANTLLSALFLLATASLIWRFLPEPSADQVPVSGPGPI
jgi:predicted MFS family arabinose efflux permease